jgi:hypothetical protein
MLIGILLVLGVSATGILILLIGLMVLKRIKTIRHPAVFKARVRITDGEFPGLKGTWKKCYGAWVTTILTTRKGLPLSITDVLPLVSLEGVREAEPADGVPGLGEKPIIASFSMVTGARIEVAMASRERSVGLRPWNVPESSATSSSP